MAKAALGPDAVAIGTAALIALGDHHPTYDAKGAQTLARARACGKAHLPYPEPADLVALTIESAAMARVPLAGTNWIPGEGL
ncbi:hypothetical protein [Streptomyces longisporus]|uniref:Uncharacterized protein n=1 Tax=Streptomyces longisporus TaxID=1948 RepID=A0ABP5YTY5_STRLO